MLFRIFFLLKRYSFWIQKRRFPKLKETTNTATIVISCVKSSPVGRFRGQIYIIDRHPKKTAYAFRLFHFWPVGERHKPAYENRFFEPVAWTRQFWKSITCDRERKGNTQFRPRPSCRYRIVVLNVIFPTTIRRADITGRFVVSSVNSAFAFRARTNKQCEISGFWGLLKSYTFVRGKFAAPVGNPTRRYCCGNRHISFSVVFNYV